MSEIKSESLTVEDITLLRTLPRVCADCTEAETNMLYDMATNFGLVHTEFIEDTDPNNGELEWRRYAAGDVLLATIDIQLENRWRELVDPVLLREELVNKLIERGLIGEATYHINMIIDDLIDDLYGVFKIGPAQ